MFTAFQIRVGAMLTALQGRLVEARDNEEGQALVEYGLILALVAVVAVVALQALGVNVLAKFNNIVSKLG